MKAEDSRQKAKGSKAEPRRAGTLSPALLFAVRFLSAFCLHPSAFILLPSACCLLPSARSAETLTLADCLRETALNNPSIIEQQFAIQAAGGSRLTLRSVALPTLTASGIGGYQGAQSSEVVASPGLGSNGRPLPAVTLARNSTLILLTSAQLTQPIFNAAIPATWRLGTLGVTAARQNFYVVASTVLASARASFVRAVYYHQREDLLHQIDLSLQNNLQAQNALVTAGLGTRQGVLTAQVQRANYDPALTANTGSYRTSLASLFQVMGRHLPEAAGRADPLDGITLAGDLEDSPLDFDPAAAVREALDNRPDLQALRTAIRIYAENSNVARAGYYPVASIFLAGQYLPQTYIAAQNSSTRASDRIETTELRPGINASWTVIDTGAVRGQIVQFDALRAALEQGLRSAELAIPAGLSTLHSQAGAASQALTALRGNVAVSQDTLNIIQAGVAQGLNSQLEFLDAQSGVVATRLGLLESQLTLSLTHAEFDRVTGRYLRYVPAAPSESPAPAKKPKSAHAHH